MTCPPRGQSHHHLLDRPRCRPVVPVAMVVSAGRPRVKVHDAVVAPVVIGAGPVVVRARVDDDGGAAKTPNRFAVAPSRARRARCRHRRRASAMRGAKVGRRHARSRRAQWRVGHAPVAATALRQAPIAPAARICSTSSSASRRAASPPPGASRPSPGPALPSPDGGARRRRPAGGAPSSSLSEVKDLAEVEDAVGRFVVGRALRGAW